MTSRIRRVRCLVPPSFDEPTALALLQSISQSRAMAAAATKQADEEEAQLLAMMKAAGRDTLCTPDARVTAEVNIPAGKATNTIDPKALRRILTDDVEYYSCISVSVTKAKEYVPAKELARITSTTPGKTGEAKLKITVRK